MATTTPSTKIVHRQCTLCEAHCGIDVHVEDNAVVRITGDKQDTFSRGYICPKAAALADLHHDPDRLRRPVKRVGDEWVEIGWDEALDLAAEGLRSVQDRHGRNAVANYLGNPGAHSTSLLAIFPLRLALGTVNNYSASSADQLPQHLVSDEMFGHALMFPVPDLDRAEHVLIIGANPSVSNGSVMTAPGARHRLREVIERGGKVIVVDPRRSETAELASEHVAVRPGGDPYLLLGMLNVLFAEGRVTLGSLAGCVDGLAEVERLAAPWTPEVAAPHAGVGADDIARLAREFSDAGRAVAYGRLGLCQQRTGSISHWLLNVLNVVTGNMDAPGGAMFPTPPIDIANALKLTKRLNVATYGRNTQRVTGMPSINGELPVAGLADEILTPGDGQVRGMLVYAGNPVLSSPNGKRLDEAMAQLEWCVAVDMYITETSRHAHVILPPVSTLERGDVDMTSFVSVRNRIRYSPPAIEKQPGALEDWEILNGLTRRLGRGIGGRLLGLHASLPEVLNSPDRMVDAALAAGPYGLRRGLKALTVARIKAAPHGIDLGPLEPRLPGALLTSGKRLQLAPGLLIDEAAELEALAAERDAERTAGFDLTLIGRRSLRSNNSWMHNSPRLMKGADRCTARLHPDDAEARGLADGDQVRVTSRVGTIELPVEVSDEMRPGVVSIPHGWGHTRAGVGWKLAAAKPGVSVNDVTDQTVVDRLTGNAAMNAVPVRVESAVAATAPPAGAAAAVG